MNDKQDLRANDTESMANVSTTSTASSGSSQKPSQVAATDDCARAIGARLAQLREHKQCLLDDVSAQLKVPVEKLRALEAGDFTHLPDTAFTVGIVRRYAKMFGVDPTPMVNELRRAYGPLEPELVLPGLRSGGPLRKHLPTMTQNRRSKKRRVWLWGIGVLVLVVCITLYWQGNKPMPTHQASVPASPSPSPSANNSSPSVSPLVANETGAQSKLFKIAHHDQHNGHDEHGQTAYSSAQLSPVTQTEVASLSPAAANKSASTESNVLGSNTLSARGQSLIHFKVSQDNWISVRQHDGQEVYASLLYAGSECDVQGVPPFKVTVGNHAGLESVTLDGKRVDPSKYTQAKQTQAKQKVVHFDLP